MVEQRVLSRSVMVEQRVSVMSADGRLMSDAQLRRAVMRLSRRVIDSSDLLTDLNTLFSVSYMMSLYPRLVPS